MLKTSNVSILITLTVVPPTPARSISNEIAVREAVLCLPSRTILKSSEIVLPMVTPANNVPIH